MPYGWCAVSDEARHVPEETSRVRTCCVPEAAPPTTWMVPLESDPTAGQAAAVGIERLTVIGTWTEPRLSKDAAGGNMKWYHAEVALSLESSPPKAYSSPLQIIGAVHAISGSPIDVHCEMVDVVASDFTWMTFCTAGVGVGARVGSAVG